MQRSEKEQNVTEEELPCFVTESSSNREAVYLEHREALLAFLGDVEAENRKEDTSPTTVLSADKEPAAKDPVTLEVSVQAPQHDWFCEK